MLLQVFAAFNQAMSGQTLPNLLPKMYQGFRDQVEALGYDADQMLMSREEFQQFFQQLLQQQQAAAQQPPDPIQQAMIQLQLESLQAEVAEKKAKANKAEAEAEKARAETMIAVQQAQSGVLDPAKVIV
jgi:membrane carboxypeptidase/penicillin-binding protein